MFDRVFLIVLDSLGVGALPDADLYGDQGSNTLGNMASVLGGLDLPNFQKLGLGNIIPIEGVMPIADCQASFGKMAEQSAGKDTTTGHWEMMGIILEQPFPVYPHGFPVDLIEKFEKIISRKVLANKVASGTVIIQEYGEEHLKTGYPIVYTSADSVFQIAAHEDIIPVEELYRICEVARGLLQGQHGVGRVIARPFTGSAGSFKRTSHRHDYSLEPIHTTVLDRLVDKGIDVTGIGKIKDIFAGKGITGHESSANNTEGLEKILAMIQSDTTGLIFANLVDFDMEYGHRNDPAGYARALTEVDSSLPALLNNLRDKDILILTGDHGCDPTTASTDHSREYVPLLVFGRRLRSGTDLGTRRTFSDLGKTVAEMLGIQCLDLPGESFLGQIT